MKTSGSIKTGASAVVVLFVVGCILINRPLFDDHDLARTGTEHLMKNEIPDALEAYRSRTGGFPVWQGRFDELIANAEYGFGDRFSEYDGKDGWGNSIAYTYPISTAGIYRLRSLGEDGVPSSDDIVVEAGAGEREVHP